MELALSFVHLVFVGFVALFPPVNPIGTALILDPLLAGLSPAGRRAASKKIAFYCFAICLVSIAIGSWLFRLFGISLPVVQLAGGALICRMGWQLLSAKDVKPEQVAPERSPGDVEGLLFYPLAFPMTTGAGTISVLLTLSAHAHGSDWAEYARNSGALLGAVALMAVLIYLSYAYSPALLARIGDRGRMILNRLSAFLVFCVGLQIALAGWELIHTT